MPQRTTPTFKQKRFAKAYIKHNGNGSKAALETYNTNKIDAKQIASQNLQKPVVIKEIERLTDQLDAKGLSIDYLNTKALQAIEQGSGVKTTQKEANDMIKFMYKLHNIIPSNKSASIKVSLKGDLSAENVDIVVNRLQKLSTTSHELIEDIS